MLTQAQYGALPELARQIVDLDRAIRIEKSGCMLDLASYRELHTRRGELRRAADRQWGVPLRGHGPSNRS